MSDPSTIEAEPKRTGRWFRRCRSVALLMLAFLIVSPAIIAHTGIRDRLINAIIGAPNLSASSERGSFGWFSPISIDGLRIDGKQHRFRVDVERVASDRSWPRLLASTPDLGRVSVEKPHVWMTVPLGESGARSSILSPTFTAAINDAALTLSHDESQDPVIEVDGVDLTVHVQDTDLGLVLSADPFDVYTRQKLTPKYCSRLLQLINPSLRDAAQIDGEFSLSLGKLHIPIGGDSEQLIERLEAEGELVLHQVTIETDNVLLETLAKLVSDIHNKQVPPHTRVVKDASIKFQARDGRLYHEGLRFGFPDIDPALEIRSYGSVGLDQTLDAYLEVPRFDSEKQQQRGPVVCHVTGTIRDPQLSAKDASLVVRLPDRDEPLIDIDGVDFTMRVEKSAGGRVISFDPVELLHREALNRQLASSLLNLVEPELQYSPQLEGEVSLSLETLRIPVSEPDEEWLKALEMKGKLVIHQATSLATTPMRQAIIKLVSDLYGKRPIEAVRVAHDTEIDFDLKEGRFHYEGLRFGLPDFEPSVEILSRGSIGLDETLDIYVEVPRFDPGKQAERGPVLCHLTGTVSNPILSAKDASLVVYLPERAEPLIDVDGVDFTLRIVESDGDRVISFDPTELLHREALNRRLASSLLHLVEPELQYSPQLEGEVSLSLETLRIPVSEPDEEWLKALQVKGKLVIHQATSLATTPMRQAIIKLLCDLYGKQPLDAVRVAHDSEIDFDLRQGRFHYQGLRVGFTDIAPSLEVLSYGSIGLDETLDIQLELPQPERDNREERGPVRCHITGTLGNPKIAIEDASLVVRLPGRTQPILDIDAIDLTMQIQGEADQPILTVAPVTVFNRQQLTPDLSQELLRLVAPTLGDVADVQGEVSLSLDAMEIPLSGSTEQILRNTGLSGQLQLHEITTTVKTPLLSAMVKVLADRFGKKPSETIRVAKNAEIRFELRDGRLFHEGLRIGFPDLSSELVCRSNGSVGLDRSLDLTLDVPSILAGSARTPDSVSDAIRFKVTGTIDEPTLVEIK